MPQDQLRQNQPRAWRRVWEREKLKSPIFSVTQSISHRSLSKQRHPRTSVTQFRIKLKNRWTLKAICTKL